MYCSITKTIPQNTSDALVSFQDSPSMLQICISLKKLKHTVTMKQAFNFASFKVKTQSAEHLTTLSERNQSSDIPLK